MKEGYWKTTSKDKDITYDKNKKIGHRKTFKFFEGDDKKPTNWIMHEYRDLNTKSVVEMDLEMDASTSNKNSDRIEHYVLCMIYEKGKKCPTNYPPSTQDKLNTGVDAFEEVYASHPHEANSLMPNMDQFPLQPYFGNDNGFSMSLEFLDDPDMRHLIELDGENMHLDFPDPNPNTMFWDS
ncbi:hypothetical protein MRB53_021643 [Persea americana]|uniref:Uncharacterized protein n=1 Tax=Persea americana TaxID=3435 RepID=A0ACC2L4K6_PERAE|nr:hypothetical protein MRB53_021643 [Persea americana]